MNRKTYILIFILSIVIAIALFNRYSGGQDIDDAGAVAIPFVGTVDDEQVAPFVAVDTAPNFMNLTDAVYKAHEDKKTLVVLVAADFCFGCVQLEKLLGDELKKEKMTGWHLAKVDFQKTPEAAKQLMGQTNLLPQLIISQFDGQQWQHRKMVGCPPQDDLAAWLYRPIGMKKEIK